MLLGQALDGLEKRPKRSQNLSNIVESNPNEPNVHFGLAYLYWKSQRYDEAKKEFQAELALDPKHASSLAYLANIELKRNNLDDAISLLQKAVSIKSDVRIVYIDLGTIFSQQKKYPEAIRALQRAIDLWNPNGPTRITAWRTFIRQLGTLPHHRKSLRKCENYSRTRKRTWYAKCHLLHRL